MSLWSSGSFALLLCLCFLLRVSFPAEQAWSFFAPDADADADAITFLTREGGRERDAGGERDTMSG